MSTIDIRTKSCIDIDAVSIVNLRYSSTRVLEYRTIDNRTVSIMSCPTVQCHVYHKMTCAIVILRGIDTGAPCTVSVAIETNNISWDLSIL